MVARGTVAYTCNHDPCKGFGYVWSQEELDAALASDVGQIARDDQGIQDILDLFNNGSTTEFDMAGLTAMFNPDEQEIKDWQVGEAIANAYLHDHRDCLVPWNTLRDLRTPKGSLPGVDICGIRGVNGQDQLFFCEVKTSSEAAYPPQVASRKPNGGGLAAQVEELRDDGRIRATIIKYLAARALNTSWKDRFCNATRRYIHNNDDISIFGFMVRDVAPNLKDLNKRVKDVAKSTTKAQIEFMALYLPYGQIASLAESLNQSITSVGGVC